MNEPRNSTIATILKICGLIVGVCGIIGGVGAGFTYPIIKVTSSLFSDFHEEQFNYLLMLLCWVSGIIFAAVLYGFGEIIAIQEDNRLLLQQISNRLTVQPSAQNNAHPESTDHSDNAENTEDSDSNEESSWVCSCGTYNYPHEKRCSRCGTPRHSEN